MEPSRLQSILNAPKSDALIDTSKADIDFALDDGDDAPADGSQPEQPTVQVLNPPMTEGEATAQKPAARRYFGMAAWQAIFLGVMAFVELALVAGFLLYIFFLSK
jgi:hypothetical protein